ESLVWLNHITICHHPQIGRKLPLLAKRPLKKGSSQTTVISLFRRKSCVAESHYNLPKTQKPAGNRESSPIITKNQGTFGHLYTKTL
ncbi:MULTISPECIES: hypothetical protein, partial [unclassified Acetobacter]|uniref:hypothetical protein n=1 Tax=unclassified Acetobacter TaxID=2628570 RepID=UPI001EE203D9